MSLFWSHLAEEGAEVAAVLTRGMCFLHQPPYSFIYLLSFRWSYSTEQLTRNPLSFFLSLRNLRFIFPGQFCALKSWEDTEERCGLEALGGEVYSSHGGHWQGFLG